MIKKRVNEFQKRRLVRQFAGQHRLAIAVAIVAGIISSLLTILIPVSFGKYYELVFDLRAIRAQFLDQLPFFDVQSPKAYLYLLLVLIALKAVFHYLERFSIARLGEWFVYEIRDTLYLRQLDLHIKIYDERGIGRYLLRYSGDLKSIRNYFTKGILRFTTDAVLLTFALLTLFLIDVGIGIIILLTWLVVVGLVFLLNIPLRKASLNKRNTSSGLLGFINTKLKGIQTIKVFNRQVPEIKRFRKRTNKILRYGVEYERIYNIIFVIVPTALYLMIGAVLWYVLWQKQQGSGQLNEGSLLSVILLLITILPVFRRILRTPVSWELGNISFEKLLKVLNVSGEISGEKNIRKRAYTIDLRDVSFRYSDSESNILTDINVVFKPHKINVLNIEQGEGKTTLIKLLTGLYAPTSGQILLGKNNIRNISLPSLRRCMTVVSSDFPLVGKTVFEVVSYSISTVKLPTVEAILASLQVGLPPQQQLFAQDKIGEFGSHLSATQQKILQYARALLTQKPILVIEEPFEALPKVVKDNIVRLLNERVEESTIVLMMSWQNLYGKLSKIHYIELASSVEV